jgi:2-polyprenyl-3-methyl-5-hydroxy-6-metoxy-1,4-benzoquinol methylase
MSNSFSDNTYIGKDLKAMSFANNYSKWIIELFSPFTGKNVAEVGAGTGSLTKILSEQDIISKVTAFEPSVKMYNYLIKNLNSNKKVSAVNSTLFEVSDNYTKQFDSIFYINVLEHIEDDKAEITRVHDSLKENGHACIFVPALSWLYSDFDRSIGHFRRYHKEQLIHLFESNGFEIVTVKYIDMLGILPWYLNFVLMKRTLDKNTTKIYDQFAIPVIKNIEKIFPSPIGKNLLLVGKKIS